MWSNNRKLRDLISDPEGELWRNTDVARRFALALDDREATEIVAMLAPDAHVASPSGVVRGRTAAIALLIEEAKLMEITFADSKPRAITANQFERRGFARLLYPADSPSASRFYGVDTIRALKSRWRPSDVRETIVVRNGLVAYRELSFTIEIIE